MPENANTDSHEHRSSANVVDPAQSDKKYWLDDLGNVQKIYRSLWILCGLLVAADLFYEKHIEFPVEGFLGFFGFYGFVSCVLLVLAAKQLRKIVGRDEDYYDR